MHLKGAISPSQFDAPGTVANQLNFVGNVFPLACSLPSQHKHLSLPPTDILWIPKFVYGFITDTSAICGFLQRHKSPVLFQKLRHLYFWMLAGIVANRAELIATERRLMRINEELVQNEVETKTKTKDLAQLWKEQKKPARKKHEKTD